MKPNFEVSVKAGAGSTAKAEKPQSQAGGAKPTASLPLRLGWVSFLNDCSSEVLARAVPLFLTASLGASPAYVGLIEGLAEAVSIFLKGFSGWLSDRMESRKPLVVIGYVCSLFARITLFAASMPLLLGASRVFERTGKGLRSASRDAMVADGAAAGMIGKAFGITRFLDTLGAVTGLLLALAFGIGTGPMTKAMFQSVIWLALPPGILSVAFLVLYVPRITRRTVAKHYIAWQIPREIRGYLAIVVLFGLANSSDAFLVLRASELGFSFREILVMLVFFNALSAALAIPAGKLSDRFGRVPFLATGWAIYGVTYLTFGLAASGSAFIVALFVYGAFYGFTEGTEKALLADLVPAEKRGTGYGALQLVLGLAALPSSLLTGVLMTRFGSSVAFGVAGGLALTAALALTAWSLWRNGHDYL